MCMSVCEEYVCVLYKIYKARLVLRIFTNSE